MKKGLLLTTALIFGATNIAAAGGLPEVVEEPPVEEQTSSSAAGIIVPLMLLAVLVAVASNDNDTATAAASDLRLKEDVRFTGMTPQGLPLYTWRYAGLPETFEGVLAQDVAMIRPDALVELPFGFKAVDYDRLGLKMRRLH